MLSRRHVVASLGSVPAATILGKYARSELRDIEMGPGSPFSFDHLRAQARAMAEQSYAEAKAADPFVIDQITYDAYQQIKYRPDRTIALVGGHDQVQLFHLGRYAPHPVKMALVKNGEAREIIYDQSLFDIPSSNPAAQLSHGSGFAGFRLMEDGLKSDWFSAIGASYFRSGSPFDQYGLSARGIAVNTASPMAEEFPRFERFWLEDSDGQTSPLRVYALLNGPSIVGAYRMEIRRVENAKKLLETEMLIEADLHLRASVDRVGIAPFSSMFWYGEAPVQQPKDWRPEIHDSDGLALLTGSGERIWRPLRNPPHVSTNAFVDTNPRGFGLLQRDRDFEHYLDDGVFYDKRPSVWVEPVGEWGAGAVHLVEMPTGEETWDNVVAYWCPADFNRAGQNKTFAYKLSWCDQPPFPDTLARTIGTWIGIGGPPGLSFKERSPNKVKIVIDFEGACFEGLDGSSGVELVLNVSRGRISNPSSYPVVGERNRWRALFDLDASGIDAVDLRAYLRRGDRALSETWIYQLNPLTS
ncbi:glucan biosynthesis protein [Hyphomicrobium sp.]|uniref:glucan biosynthesis protein n=1 Tax=Hyphomicrobium sp. TaxID=82 RepID=UPI000FA083BD|nr:glucan biosynthesis protein [Hyphomicrobium sp.]RUP00544.1 MAG: glucans biosynthesis protein [Hyphomicrobium sp.]